MSISAKCNVCKIEIGTEYSKLKHQLIINKLRELGVTCHKNKMDNYKLLKHELMHKNKKQLRLLGLYINNNRLTYLPTDKDELINHLILTEYPYTCHINKLTFQQIIEKMQMLNIPVNDNKLLNYDRLECYLLNQSSGMLRLTCEQNNIPINKLHNGVRELVSLLLMTNIKFNLCDNKGAINNTSIVSNDIKKKKIIPPKLRELVWKTYIGNNITQPCPICEITEITSFSFECGHVISECNGGTNDIENLRAICKSCNSSMGIKHMYQYALEFYPNASIIKTFTNKKEQTSNTITEETKIIESTSTIVPMPTQEQVETIETIDEDKQEIDNNKNSMQKIKKHFIDNSTNCYILPNSNCNKDQCNLRHIVLCPEYISKFYCSKPMCEYSHKKACMAYGKYGKCNKNKCFYAHVNGICRFYIHKNCKSPPGMCKYKHVDIGYNKINKLPEVDYLYTQVDDIIPNDLLQSLNTSAIL